MNGAVLGLRMVTRLSFVPAVCCVVLCRPNPLSFLVFSPLYGHVSLFNHFDNGFQSLGVYDVDFATTTNLCRLCAANEIRISLSTMLLE